MEKFKIYKYTVFTANTGLRSLPILPKEGKIIHIAEQDSCINFWVQATLEQHNILVAREFVLVGTGMVASPTPPENYEYLDTIIMDNFYVWHVFEIKGNIK